MSEKKSVDQEITSSDKQRESQSDAFRLLSPEEMVAVAGGPLIQNQAR